MKDANVRKETLKYNVDRDLYYSTLPTTLNLSNNLRNFVNYSSLVFIIILISTIAFLLFKRFYDELNIKI